MRFSTENSEFLPLETLENKRNFKEFYGILPNGEAVKRIFLNVTDQNLREKIICFHYLQFAVSHFLEQEIGVQIISRDNPWDFELGLGNGDQFFVEITSLADNKQHFQINKREETVAALILATQGLSSILL